jgi:CRISPR-associated protein Csm3
MKLIGKIIIKSKIETLTGLHIGGLKETLKIGGLDNPVIRDAQGRVFIPGSSLKGKIRCLLERAGYPDKTRQNNKENSSKEKNETPCSCGTCIICKLFGTHQSKNIEEIRRLIFRDAYLVGDDGRIIESWEAREKYLEVKPENVIDRITGTAKSPRFIERVVAGVKFDSEIILDVYDEDLENENGLEKMLNTIITGLKLLEDDYLGGSGSRGYGKVKFKGFKIIVKKIESDEYKEKAVLENISSIKNLSEKIEDIIKEFKGESQ